MKSSELSREDLISMIGALRGALYDTTRDKIDTQDMEEAKEILIDTAFDMTEDQNFTGWHLLRERIRASKSSL